MIRCTSRRRTAGARWLASALLVAAPAPAVHAQSAALGGCEPDGPTPAFMSAESDLHYACGWLFASNPPQPGNALSYLRSALGKSRDDAIAPFLLGLAHLGTGQADSARYWITRARELDPAVETRLAPRLAEQPGYRARIAQLFVPSAPSAPAGPAAPAAPTSTRPAANPPARPTGTTVPAPRTPTASQQPTPTPPKPRSQPATPVRQTDAGALAHGAYNCAHEYFSGGRQVRNPKGSLTLRANGSYRLHDNGSEGRFRYDQATGRIAWLSGPLADMKPAWTTYRRNERTAQIEIMLEDPYGWSCGINLPGR